MNTTLSNQPNQPDQPAKQQTIQQHRTGQSAVDRHAIVIGGSMSGLLAARVLSDHFSQVTLIERDALSDAPEPRPGQPQTRHLHGLLASGKAILERYFPDLIDALVTEGATLADIAKDSHWHVAGDYRLKYESGWRGILLSRPFLEWQIRRRVLALPNLTVLDCTAVEELLTPADRSQVTGVRVRTRGAAVKNQTGDNQSGVLNPSSVLNADLSADLSADLVVDASGRNSASPRWLAALGYAQPPKTVVTVGVSYATRIYRRQPGDLSGAVSVLISPEPPHHQRAGLAFPIEGDRWIVTLAGWMGDPAPLDEAGFLSFAQNLPAPDIYHLIAQAEPLSEITGYRFPASLRRHYERLRRFPSGYLVMGDAVCSFDPAYGQGMSSAALQAALLDQLLQQQQGQSLQGQQLSRQLSWHFFQQAAKIIDIPWQLTVSEDFRFPGTQGKKPLGTDLVNAYGTWLQRATHRDPVVYGAFIKVMNLMASPLSLFHPNIVWRVVQAAWQSRHSASAKSSQQPSGSRVQAGMF